MLEVQYKVGTRLSGTKGVSLDTWREGKDDVRCVAVAADNDFRRRRRLSFSLSFDGYEIFVSVRHGDDKVVVGLRGSYIFFKFVINKYKYKYKYFKG